MPVVGFKVTHLEKLGDAYSSAFLAENIAKNSELTEKDKEALASATVRCCRSVLAFFEANPLLRNSMYWK